MLLMIERFAWNWAILNEKAIEDCYRHRGGVALP
jgi:hypothetical protein